MISANSLGVQFVGQLTASEPFPRSLVLEETGTELERRARGWGCVAWALQVDGFLLLQTPLQKGSGQSIWQEAWPLPSLGLSCPIFWLLDEERRPRKSLGSPFATVCPENPTWVCRRCV